MKSPKDICELAVVMTAAMQSDLGNIKPSLVGALSALIWVLDSKSAFPISGVQEAAGTLDMLHKETRGDIQEAMKDVVARLAISGDYGELIETLFEAEGE